MLKPTDDLRHDMPDDPDASEGLAHVLMLPDEGIWLNAYVTLKPGGKGRRMLGILHNGSEQSIDLDEGTVEGDDYDDFTLCGMRITQPERLRRASVSYTGPNSAIEYDFVALHDAFDYAQNRDGCPAPLAENRFEQAGLVTGTLTLGDKVIKFDTCGHRDHSWGVRDYQSLLHWKWISAQAGPDLAFNAMHSWYHGKQWTNGFVYRDNRLSPIVDMQIAVTYDENVVQRSAKIRLVDEADRVTEATAERYVHSIVSYPGATFVETGCRFVIAGQQGQGHLEVGWRPEDHDRLRDGRRVEIA